MGSEKESEKQPNSALKKTFKAIITLLLVSFIVALAGFFVYLDWALKTPISENSNKQLFEVKSGQGTLEIAVRLKNKDLIRSDWVFYLETKMKDRTLAPGIYELSENMSIEDDLDTISNGKTKIVKVTIPEGYRTEQIGQTLAKKKIADYTKFVEAAKPYEGKLFPDTYYFSPDYTISQIVLAMRQDFTERTSNLNLTTKDLIIASIVEKEADTDAERPIIAGIYKNRLNSDMKLQSDPTVEYAKDSIALRSLPAKEQLGYKFWQPITNTDLKTVDSSYSTYISTGLPPGPICNPGLASLKATINSTASDYLYFIVTNGQIYPAKTYDEHKQNIQEHMN